MSQFDERYLVSPSSGPAVSTSSSTENLPQSQAPPAIVQQDEKGMPLDSTDPEFNPCLNAGPCSPFYNHDSPRASVDQPKPKSSLHVAVRDLEAQNILTPAHTPDARPSPNDGGALRQWASSRTKIFGQNKRQQKHESMTYPRNRSCSCMSNMSKRKRLLIKILIALVIIGAMVGIGVGISVRVGGEVYKDSHSTSKIGNA